MSQNSVVIDGGVGEGASDRPGLVLRRFGKYVGKRRSVRLLFWLTCCANPNGWTAAHRIEHKDG